MLLERLVVAIEATTEQFNKQMDATAKKVQAVGDKVAKVGQKLTTFVTLPIAGAGVAAVNMASDLDESLNKVTVVFGEQAAAVTEWSKASATAFGMSQQQALEAAGTYGNLFVSMGMTNQMSSDMSTNLVQLAGDLASFNNVSPDEALLALRAGLVGETEPLKRFGVNLNEATLKAKAMEMGLYDGKGVLDANAKAQAAYAIIMEQTTTAQGDYARTSDGLANTMRTLKAMLVDTAASLGKILLPYVLKFATAAKEWLDKLQNLTPEQQKLILIIAGVVAAIGPLLLIVGKLMTLWPLLSGAVTAVVGGFSTLASVFGAVVAAFQAGGIGAGIASLVAAVNPITLVIAAIAALVAGFVLAWKKSEDFRDFWKDLWFVISSTAVALWEGTIKPMIDAMAEKLNEAKTKMQPAMDALVQLWEALKPVITTVVVVIGAILAVLTGIVMGVVNGIIGAIEGFIQFFTGVVEIVTGIINLIVGIFTGDGEKIKEAVGQIGQGIVDVFGGLWNAIVGFLEGFVTGVIDFFTGLWDTLVGHSIVPDIVNGIIEWIAKLPEEVLAIIGNLVTRFVEAVLSLQQRTLAGIRGLVDGAVRFLEALPGEIDRLMRAALNAASEIAGNFVQIGTDIVEGIKRGVSNGWGAFKRFITDKIGNVIQWAKDILGISSPSKVFAEIGEFTGEGLAVGLGNKARKVAEAAREMVNGVVDAGKDLSLSAPSVLVPATALAGAGAAVGGISRAAIEAGGQVVHNYYTIGDVTVDARDFEGVRDINEFVDMLRRKKRQAGGE